MIRHSVVITVHVFFRRENNVLLLRRANTGWGDGMYSVPAGHLDADENILEAAAREAKEEVGVNIQPEQLTFAHVMHMRNCADGLDRVHFFFECRDFEGEATNAEPHLCDEVRWVDTRNLPDNVLPYIKTTLDSIRDGIPYRENVETRP